LQAEGYGSFDVSILLTDDKEIQSLNLQYRSIDKPTDVLSFSQFEPHSIPQTSSSVPFTILGDVVISFDTAKKQAARFDITLAEELSLLVIHGILHLLGYEDEDDESALCMREKERAALEECGMRHRYGVMD
jgi:probable rRNA maturation factor